MLKSYFNLTVHPDTARDILHILTEYTYIYADSWEEKYPCTEMLTACMAIRTPEQIEQFL
jgi:hypothetical protein